MLQPPQVLSSANRIIKSFKSMEKVCIDRKTILRQAMFALVTRNHLLLEGPPGVAKSHLAHTLFKALTGAETFKVQCTKKMSEDYLVGPLDMRLFREEGEYYHKVQGYLPTAHYAFLDEFLDLSTGALRALLEILNERTFSRGPQAVKCPLGTAIAATNFSGDSEVAVEAVMDRFLFKAKVRPLGDSKSRKAMLLLDTAKITVPEFSHEDVRRVSAAIDRVVVPTRLIEPYLQICSGLSLTDRTVRKALCVLRASAALNGRRIAILEDLPALETCFAITGDPTSEGAFARSLAHYKHALDLREAEISSQVVGARLSQLKAMMMTATTYQEALPIAYEAREAQGALNSVQNQTNAVAVGQSMTVCQAILNRATELYNKEKTK